MIAIFQMETPTLWYAALLTFSGTLSLVTAFLVWRRRQAAAALPLAIFMLTVSVWALTYAAHWMARTPEAQAFWLDATYLGAATCPVAFFAFAAAYTHREHWLSRRTLIVLSIPSALILLAMWTDAWHGLFYGGTRVLTAHRIFEGGPVFWVGVLYLYSLNLFSCGLLIQSFFRASQLYRHQATFILIGALIPFVVNILIFLKLDPLPEIDLTPVAFIIATFFFAYALFYRGLFDLVPVARGHVFETMREGVIVLDNQDRIIDLNPAAQRLLNAPRQNTIGSPIAQAWRECLPALQQARETRGASNATLTLPATDTQLDIQFTPLQNRRAQPTGLLMVLHDITAQKQVEAELRLQLERNQLLQAQLHEQAMRDPLTNLYNRRHFQEMFDHELARATRTHASLVLLVLDIDHFKQFNDTYGHNTGDEILCALAGLLESSCRGNDIVCRYGGEEFAVLFENITLEQAERRAQQLRATFQKMNLKYGAESLHTTFSGGLAAYPVHGITRPELLEQADRALYAAKAAGRNRIVVAHMETVT